MARATSIAILVLVSNLVLGSVVEHVGYLEPGRSIKISAPEPSVIQEVFVTEGQVVEAGQVIAQLDVRILEIEARIARAELAMLSERLDKLGKLLPQRFASEDELLRAENEFTIASLKVERIEAQIERLTLRSPIDGVVTEIRFDVAESVPGPSSHVATVVQLDPMRVQFSLPLVEVATLVQGAHVDVYFPDVDESRPGIVEFISPVSTAVVNTVRVVVSIPKPGTLPAGIRTVLTDLKQTDLTSTQ